MLINSQSITLYALYLSSSGWFAPVTSKAVNTASILFYTGISSDYDSPSYADDIVNINTTSFSYCPYYNNSINDGEEGVFYTGMDRRQLKFLQAGLQNRGYYYTILIAFENTVIKIAKTRLIGQYILNQNCMQLILEVLWSRNYMSCTVRSKAATNPGDKQNSQQDYISFTSTTDSRSFGKIYNSYSSSHLYVHKNFTDDVDTSIVTCLYFNRQSGNVLISCAFNLGRGSVTSNQTSIGGSSFSFGWNIKTLGFQDVQGYLLLQVNRSNFSIIIVVGNYELNSSGLTSNVDYFVSSRDSVLCSNAGPNIWMSFDRKWIFFPPRWTTSVITYPKGLNSYYSGNPFINAKGSTSIIPSNNNYFNTSHTSAIRSALSNVYVQEIIFNKTSDKMIVLTSSTSGCFGPADGSDNFDGDSHNPDKMFAFVYQASAASWINVSSMVDKVNLMSSYNESDSLKRPTMYAYPLTDNEGQYLFSFGKPANTPTAYYTNTIW